MNATQLGQAHRALRHRQQLRQQDVSDKSGVARSAVSLIERGEVAALPMRDVERSFEALGARLEVNAVWRGAGLSRLLDEGHARLSGQALKLLVRLGWRVEVEVSYAHYGERGTIDLLAWHAAAGALLVIEIKTELASVEGLLRPLDAKVRLGPLIAVERFGWQARAVARLVVFPEESTVRRNVARHEAVLTAALPMRSRAVRAWLRDPVGPIAGIWFLSPDRGTRTIRNPSAIRRIRRPRARSDDGRREGSGHA